MKIHNYHALGWVIWAFASAAFFAVWEWTALKDRDDLKHPLTYYIRKLVGTWNNPVWWILLAILLWMIVHFLVIHDTPAKAAVGAAVNKMLGGGHSHG